jgi:hypothetical protein
VVGIELQGFKSRAITGQITVVVALRRTRWHFDAFIR